MNRKGMFMIAPVEIYRLGITLAFGVFAWLVYSGVRDWIVETFELTLVGSIFTGLFGLAGILFLIKYSPFKFG